MLGKKRCMAVNTFTTNIPPLPSFNHRLDRILAAEIAVHGRLKSVACRLGPAFHAASNILTRVARRKLPNRGLTMTAERTNAPALKRHRLDLIFVKQFRTSSGNILIFSRRRTRYPLGDLGLYLLSSGPMAAVTMPECLARHFGPGPRM